MKKVKRILSGLLSLMLVLAIAPMPAIAQTVDTVSADELVNLFDPSTAFAGYINGSNQEKTSTSHYTSDYIAVTAGDVVYFGPANPSQDFHLHGYNDAKAIADSTVRKDKLTQVDSFGNYVIYAYTVPSGVTSVRLANASAFNNIYTVTVNQKFDKEVFGTYWTANETRKAALAPFGNYFTPKTNSVLYQKSALFVGDSICAATQDAGLYYRGWAGRIGEINGMDYINGGVSGASCSTTRVANRIVTQLLKYSDRAFDYVILHGGVNDAWDSRTVGTVSDGYDLKDFDTTTFAGGLEEMIFHALKCYPTANIGYIMNFAAPSCTKGTVGNMDAYFAVAKQICEKWNIPYLNLYENDDFCNNVLKVTTDTYLPDYIHPNAAGYDLLYPVIEAWMETLTPVTQNKAGSSVIEVKTEADLRNISKMLTADYVLQNDIELASNWTPITVFEGTLNGNGHTVSNLNIVNAATANWGTAGLFGQAFNAEITNLTLKGTMTNNASGVSVQLGSFVGNPRNVVMENCVSYVDISTGTDSQNVYAGGIIGVEHNGAVLKNCKNYGRIYIRNQSTAAYCYVGGICAFANTSVTFDGCVNSGTIDAQLPCGDYAYVGGILGYASYGADAKISLTGCINAGEINAKGIVGGICGFSKQYELVIDACKNTANITSTAMASGILATAQTGTTYKDIVIQNCAVLGITEDIAITATNTGALSAGIFAQLNAKNVGFTVSGCLNAAKIVSGGNYAAGIVAQANNAGTRPIAIRYCTNLGRVEAGGTAVFLGGIIGRANQTLVTDSYVNNCYNAGEISAPNNKTGFVGAIAGSEGAANYDNNFSTVSPIFGYGKAVASQTNTKVLTADDEPETVVATLNAGKDANINGFRYNSTQDAIEPDYFLTQAPSTFIGTQVTPVNRNDKYSIRFISVLESVDYDAAGFRISAKITQGTTVTTVENAEYPVSVAYKSINENTEEELKKIDSPVGTYFMACKMYDIPADAVIEFTVTPYTVSDGNTVLGTSYQVTYANGSVVR